MAEPIGVASGLVAFAAVALKASFVLIETIRSFGHQPKQVRDLIEELETLGGVLSTLTETIDASTTVDLSALELPLKRCGNACTEFRQEILNCLSRSGGDRSSFRDWVKLRYMGDDINSFNQLLAGYKSTINIALTDANLRKSVVTAETLEKHKAQIQTATDDLEYHLQRIDQKLQSVLERTAAGSDPNANELLVMKEERLSTQKCLQICSQLSDHIRLLQPSFNNPRTPGDAGTDRFPEQVTHEGLDQCRQSLSFTAARLEKHMQELMSRLMAKSKSAVPSEEEAVDLARLWDEWQTTRKCMDICSEAGGHLKGDISIIDNFATGDDTIQVLVSTSAKTIHGHFSDESLQQLSRDMSNTSLHISTSQSRPSSSSEPATQSGEAKGEEVAEFDGRWGPGVTLMSQPPQGRPSGS
ncbi:hypothetical protein ACJ41O_015255 [Fusarium nematophilum]